MTDDGDPYHRKMCPEGTYYTSTGATAITECVDCDAGKACEEKGMSTASSDLPDCAAGFYCASGSPTRYPYTDVDGDYGPCPIGYYCAEGTSSPTACPAGTFSYQERAISEDYCLVCPPGFMCEDEGLSEPTGPSSAGIKTDDGISENVVCSTTSSDYCPLGTYQAQQCYTGYYQDVAGKGYCEECPAGQYCINGTPQNCLAGYYCP